MKVWLALLFTGLITILGCTPKEQPPVTIAINPWPGYEYLYLADQMGFFEDVGANIKLVQITSLSDAQRAYVNHRVDGLASTLIEAVQIEYLGGKPLSVILIADYSNGGDVIIANKEYPDLRSLKGKTIGAELSSLGIFVLQRSLNKVSMELSDVKLSNVEQLYGEQQLINGKIDAFVSYPPTSVNILKHRQFHTVFSSAEIPNEIIDTVSIANHVLAAQPDLPKKIHAAWQMALDYEEENPEQAVKIMAQREGISVDDFNAVISDLVIVDRRSQQVLFSNPNLMEDTAKAVCETLVHAQTLVNVDCDKQRSIFWRGDI